MNARMSILPLRIGGPAAIYFAVIFGCGFVLGSIRVPLLVPRVGVRVAELIELPIMVTIIVFVSRWRQRRAPYTGSCVGAPTCDAITVLTACVQRRHDCAV